MGAQEDYEETVAFAQRLKLEDEDASKFVSDTMKRFGHRPRVVWEDAEEGGDDGDEGGDFFTRKREGKSNERRTREVADKGGKNQSRSSGDWQYGS